MTEAKYQTAEIDEEAHSSISFTQAISSAALMPAWLASLQPSHVDATCAALPLQPTGYPPAPSRTVR